MSFSTDGAILTDRLVLLRDDRGFWPGYHVAPVVRNATLALEPRIAHVLNAISPGITDRAAQGMNAAVEGLHRDPADVASGFLAALHS